MSNRSCLQVRGSIPLYWSQQQQGSRLSKPDILLQTFDPLYSATRSHFEDMQVWLQPLHISYFLLLDLGQPAHVSRSCAA